MGNCGRYLLCVGENENYSSEFINPRSISPHNSFSDLSPTKLADTIKLNSVNEDKGIEIKQYNSFKVPMIRRTLSNAHLVDTNHIIERKSENPLHFRRSHTRSTTLQKPSFLFRAKEKLRRETINLSVYTHFKDESVEEESTGPFTSVLTTRTNKDESNYISLLLGDTDPSDN